jgi:hypothetical protein
MSFSLKTQFDDMGGKHTSTTLKVTVRLGEVEICFR